jgi:hypothetical protein
LLPRITTAIASSRWIVEGNGVVPLSGVEVTPPGGPPEGI